MIIRGKQEREAISYAVSLIVVVNPRQTSGEISWDSVCR